MTSKTVTASFKATIVYPLNCKAIDIPGAMNDQPIIIPTEKLAKWKGITRSCSEKEKSPSSEVTFSEKN